MVGQGIRDWLNEVRPGRFLPALALVGTLSGISQLSAQGFLEGRWEGTLESYDSMGVVSSYRMELFLELDGKEVTGRCFVHFSEGNVIAMEVDGFLYEDRSIYLLDQKHLGPNLEKSPPFYRKYQLLSDRSIWKTTLEGYWQEVVGDDPMSKKRKLGKVKLRKLDNSKA